jgi:hypothetical protein
MSRTKQDWERLMKFFIKQGYDIDPTDDLWMEEYISYEHKYKDIVRIIENYINDANAMKLKMKLNTTIHIPDSMKRELKAKAAQRGLTMNSAILTAIALYLQSDK